MHEWIQNGAQLGWLIDPKRRSVTIFRPGSDAEERLNLQSLDGEGPVEGFRLQLARIWQGL